MIPRDRSSLNVIDIFLEGIRYLSLMAIVRRMPGLARVSRLIRLVTRARPALIAPSMLVILRVVL